MANRFDVKRTVTLVAASALLAGAALQGASAQGARVHIGRTQLAPSYYIQLPTEVRVRPGTARILRSRCDGSYPMDESSPCGTATGGPVGGRGS